MLDNEPELLNKKDIIRILRISESTYNRRIIAKKAIPYTDIIGARVRLFKKQDVINYINSKEE